MKRTLVIGLSALAVIQAEVPKIKPITLPKVSVPTVKVPKLSVPTLKTPEVTVPKVSGPRSKVGLKVPKLTVPKIKPITVPKLKTPTLKKPPKVTVPKVKAPKLKAPKLEVPKVKVPKITAPKIKPISIPKISIPHLSMAELTAALKEHFGSDPATLTQLSTNLKSLSVKIPKLALPDLGTVLKSAMPDPTKFKNLIDHLSKMNPKEAGAAVTELAALEAKLKRVQAALKLAETDPAQFKRTAHKLKGLISATLTDLLSAPGRVNITGIEFTHGIQPTLEGSLFKLVVTGTASGKKFETTMNVDMNKLDWDKLPHIISKKIITQMGKAILA